VKTRTALTAVFASAVTVVVGWQLGAIALGTAGSSTTVQGPVKQPSVKLTDGTYAGTSVVTQFGDVQVQIVVSGGRISDATTPVLTGNEGRSEQINNQAAPILRSELLASQSAKIASVSGATYTSDAYITSLQAALDKAKA
jgi:uncharacterized protein with FMN-binding domain